MKRHPSNHRQLHTLYAADDGRVTGGTGWEKLPLFWFLLFLSYECTRRCRYCYTFNQVGDTDPPRMDENRFAALLDWIPRVWETNNVKVNIINFLGGEPLMDTPRIRRVMETVTHTTAGMQGMVNTNADLVDRIDWDDLHAIQWITVNATDTGIPELARRMNVIARHSNVINQTIAATLDDANLHRILDLTRFAMDNGYRLRFNKDLFKGSDPAYLDRLLENYHALCDLLETYAVRGYAVHTTFLLDFLIPLWNRDTSPYPCGRRVAVVFPDGGTGACIRDHRTRTGTIFEHDQDPLAAVRCPTYHFDRLEPDIPGECRTCESGTVCQGGCPHDKLVHRGSRAGKSIACRIHREIIPRLRDLARTPLPDGA